MFSDNLKRIRTSAGITQQALAKKMGVSLRTLQNWEQGRREPRLNVINQLADALGTGPEALTARAPARTRKAK